MTALIPNYGKPHVVDVMAEGASRKNLYVGWFYNVDLAGWRPYTITQGCSSGLSHSWGDTTDTRSRGNGRIFASRLDALKAARWEATEKIMKILVKIDEEIEREAHHDNFS